MSYYHLLDHPLVLQYAFYPHNEVSECPRFAFDFTVPVEDYNHVSCRFFKGDPNYPSLLYFHGNGELAGDYDQIAPFYFKLVGVNLIVAEFRGYGGSSGFPTFAGLISDALPILRTAKEKILSQGFREEIWVMGRSMGSVPALELAGRHAEEISGLIIESGFPCATRLARRLQLPVAETDLQVIENECLEKIRGITLPVLIIHGEQDSLVAVEEAYTLEKEIGSSDKRLIIIPGADHNSVIAEDFNGYFQAIKEFIGGNR
jgi:alpha-beta hydrolase superfamily lysophospholipase